MCDGIPVHKMEKLSVLVVLSEVASTYAEAKGKMMSREVDSISYSNFVFKDISDLPSLEEFLAKRDEYDLVLLESEVLNRGMTFMIFKSLFSKKIEVAIY